NLDDLILKFMGQESKWNLSGNFNIDAVEIVEGNVTIGDGNIQLNTLSSSGTGIKNLFLDETSISGLAGLSFDVSGVTLSANNTQMVASAPLVYSVDLGTNDFDGTFNLQGGEVNVGGSGAVDKVVGNGILNITGNHTWNSLTLNEGSVLTIAESSVQKIVDAFFLQATSGNRVAVESSGTGLATLDFEIHQKICLDNLDIENVTVTGQATLNAGSNSNLINSPNWFQDDCANILFPDFDIEFNCENAAVFFIDKSSGPVTNRNWDFGDEGSLSNESTLTNPVHLFSVGNQFTVTLTVSNGTATESFSKPVELNSTLLLENKVELSNGKLISFLPANKYQWVLNGELLDDTNLRSIDFSGSEGLYAVLTFDDNCNRQSETFLVTGLEESFGQQSIQVYPNPTQGEVFVIGDEINDVQVVNSVGQIIAA
ncbi:MAG: PKD domain-containing protein, partial [Cyclobacteriaceae bacterium]